MNTTKNDTPHVRNDNKESDLPPRSSDLGWEGHVHFPTGIPLWKRVLESWPELRTGLAFSLVFGAGVLLGSAVTSLIGTKQSKSEG